MNKVALVMDLRGREFFDHLFKALDDLAESFLGDAANSFSRC